MNYYCLPYFVDLFGNFGDVSLKSLICTVGLQDNTALKMSLIKSYLSSSRMKVFADKGMFLRGPETLAYGLSFLQKLRWSFYLLTQLQLLMP